MSHEWASSAVRDAVGAGSAVRDAVGAGNRSHASDKGRIMLSQNSSEAPPLRSIIIVMTARCTSAA